jgi:hypothetical protein
MLLKPSYRHVYMSRKFAIKHSFLPIDAAPGNYGYGGLITIGKWPITLVPSALSHSRSHLIRHPMTILQVHGPLQLRHRSKSSTIGGIENTTIVPGV